MYQLPASPPATATTTASSTWIIVAAEYTFFLAIPVMFGASLLKIVKFGFGFTGTQLAVLLLGMAVAFAVSVAAIKFLMNYIKKHDFSVFGWYRIALGVIVLICAAWLL